MPIITFDKQHLDEGFMFLCRPGEVGCLPDDVFVITDPLFDLLRQSEIPFTLVEREPDSEQGGGCAESENKRKKDGKVLV